MLIWPDGITWDSEAETVRVQDELGRVAARVGDYIRLSRAAFTFQEAAERELVRGLSEDCAEPYFLVGDEVSVFDPGSEATELRLSDPDVVFFRERTFVARHQALLETAGVGELILDGQCLRLNYDSPSITAAHDLEGFVGVACDGIARPEPDVFVSIATTVT